MVEQPSLFATEPEPADEPRDDERWRRSPRIRFYVTFLWNTVAGADVKPRKREQARLEEIAYDALQAAAELWADREQ